jgi:hypothetical protein
MIRRDADECRVASTGQPGFRTDLKRKLVSPACGRGDGWSRGERILGLASFIWALTSATPSRGPLK